MKVFLLIFSFILSFSLFSQGKEGVAVTPKRKKVDTNYIQSTYEKLQLRFDLNTITNQLNFGNPGGLRDFNLEPNNEFHARISASYRWLNLSYSYAPHIGSLNENGGEKGTSDVFGIELNLNLNALQQKISLRRTEGYYQINTEDYRTDLIANGVNVPYLLFPDMKSLQIGFENYYYFNSKKFSSRFARNQNEKQLRSAGSPISFLGAYYSDIDGRDQDFSFLSFLPEVSRDYPNRSRNYYGIIGGGYAYNFIFRKNFYFTIQAVPVMGVQYSKVGLSDGVTENKTTNFTVGFTGETSLGYNSDRWFGGAYFNYVNYTSPNADFRVSGEEEFVMLFVGYRFKAPKILRKSFDGIERVFKKKK